MHFELPPVVDIASVEALKGQLEPLLLQSDSVTLGAAQVERIDGSALQLLCAFLQAAESQALPVSWEQPSAELLAGAQLMDFQHYLKLA